MDKAIKKATGILAAALLFTMILTGCSEKEHDKALLPQNPSEGLDGGYKIAWYATAPHPYFDDVMLGVEAFERDYEIDVKKQVGPDWNPDNEVNNIEELAAKGYKLFSIYPPESQAIKSLYEDISKSGCRIVDFGAKSVEPTKADFYVGTDIKAAAETACVELIKSMGGKGNIVNVLEVPGDTNTIIRKNAINDVVKKYPGVKIIKEISGITTVEEAVQKINSYVSMNTGIIDGIISTGDAISVGVAQVLTELSVKSDRKVHAVLMGVDPIVVKAIKEGTIDATIAQNPYGMGYLSCLLLKYIQDGWSPKTGKYTAIDVGFIVANKNNLDSIQKQMVQRTTEIKDSIEADYLTK